MANYPVEGTHKVTYRGSGVAKVASRRHRSRCLYHSGHKQCKIKGYCSSSSQCSFYNDGSRHETYSNFIKDYQNIDNIKVYHDSSSQKKAELLIEGNYYRVSEKGSGIFGQKVQLIEIMSAKKFKVRLGSTIYFVCQLSLIKD